MSNNPFIKSKVASNRFQNLDDTPDVSINRDNRDNRKNTPYDSTANSFTQSRMRNNQTLKVTQQTIDPNNITLFPHLNTHISKRDTNTVPINYKVLVANMIDPIVTDHSELSETHVKPGWVEISQINNTNIYKYGEPTPFMKRLEELEQEPEYDPNDIMNKAIDIMSKNWKRYEKYYDELNGEGSYEEQFKLPPVYDSDYDDSDTDDENDSQYN